MKIFKSVILKIFGGRKRDGFVVPPLEIIKGTVRKDEEGKVCLVRELAFGRKLECAPDNTVRRLCGENISCKRHVSDGGDCFARRRISVYGTDRADNKKEEEVCAQMHEDVLDRMIGNLSGLRGLNVAEREIQNDRDPFEF